MFFWGGSGYPERCFDFQKIMFVKEMPDTLHEFGAKAKVFGLTRQIELIVLLRCIHFYAAFQNNSEARRAKREERGVFYIRCSDDG